MPSPSPVLVKCEHCGKTNRVPATAKGSPRCGNCHQPLPWIVSAGEDTFAEIAEQANIPVLVDMWAPWCGPCRMVSPALEQVAREMAGRLKLVKVNLDDAPRLQQRFAVQAIPTLMILQRGQVIASKAGAAPAAQLRAWVEQALTSAPRPASAGA
jgi:thioredoxin 2